jgi:exonuclease SbcC
MKITIMNLILRNFKGIKQFDLVLDGRNADISAANGLGKTTLYDGFLWVLFDKDSTNRKDFSVKTTDENGNELHGLEHEVELILSVDGQELKLKKQLTEKWTKKRGEAEKEFTGHETAYWIDDVPTKKNEYVARINELIKEDIFKLLTNPYYFNQQFDWRERRKLLLEISGDVTDQQVINSDKQLSKLTEILAGKSTEDYKKILQERIKKLNQEIEKIPVRIDELNSTLLTSNSSVNYEVVEAGISDFKTQLSAIEKELAGSQESANQLRQKQQQLFKLLGKDMAVLREKWSKENSREFVPPDEDNFICPTCLRPLPEDDVSAKIEEMKQNFEKCKKAYIDGINADGKSLKAKKEALEFTNTELNDKLLKCEANLQELTDRLEEIKKEQSLQAEIEINYMDDSEFRIMSINHKSLKFDLEKPVEDTNAELLQKKQEITKKIEDLNRILNQKEVAERTKARIQELKDEERKLSQQITELEGHRYLIEQFVKAKVNLLEDSINSRFKSVKFKLFNTLINGGVEECCETLVNGVPFADANHAGQINAGIDIINTLSEHYGLSCPLWIDNAEAINDLAEVNGQVIRLVVSQDKELKVEVK